MKYGINETCKRVCKTHQQAYNVDESCPWCPVDRYPASTHTVHHVSYATADTDPNADPVCQWCGGTGRYQATPTTSIACTCTYTPGYP